MSCAKTGEPTEMTLWGHSCGSKEACIR